MKRYKYISFILLILAIIACVMAFVVCFKDEYTTLYHVEMKKVSNDIGVIFATLAGSLATCATFMWQYYGFKTTLKENELQNKKENIYSLVHELITERDSLKIRYPKINNLWQGIKLKATGIEAFQQIFNLAEVLYKNLNEENYLNYDEVMSEQLYDKCTEEILKWRTCNDKEQYDEAKEQSLHTKEQMYQGLCNRFVGLNEDVYRINHNKPENIKKELCAYYILEIYKRPLTKYLEISCKLSQKLNPLVKNYDAKDLEDVKDYIQSVLSLSEMRLFEEYLITKKKELSYLIDKF